jgi:hypothetical protein
MPEPGKKIKLFLFKLGLFSIPFLGFIILYIYWDPFKVVKSYACYYQSGQPNYITLNKDFVSTENWIHHEGQDHYDSYIFGNSRSMFYQIGTWIKYIHAEPEKCYHFDASAESLFGIARKLIFLRARHAPVRNALFIIDAGSLNKADNSAGHIFVKDPNISGESRIAFQVDFIKDFFDFDFLRALTDFKLSGKIKEYMTQDFLLDDRPFFYDCVTNEVRLDSFDKMIERDPSSYYGPRAALFYARDSGVRYSAPMIREKQLALLLAMKKILQEDRTLFRIIINPLYDQIKLNPRDLSILQNTFGKQNVFDFSGINDFTGNKHNFYETSHYRPPIADEIMKIVYTRPNSAP